jgi:hypothetical protein
MKDLQKRIVLLGGKQNQPYQSTRRLKAQRMRTLCPFRSVLIDLYIITVSHSAQSI